MKYYKLIAICIIGVVLLLGILCEMGTLKLNLYKNDISTNINSSWNNSKSIVRLTESTEEISFDSVPVVVMFKSKKVGDILSPNPLIIDISDKDFGSLWIPFIKKSSFDFTVIHKDKAEIRTDFATGHLEINGEIHLSGSYKIIGICSSENARNMIVEKVMNAIYENVKKHIK